MKQLFLLPLFVLFFVFSAHAQSQPLTYYLPDIAYNPEIPTPESVLGHQIGDWHITHDQSLLYMRTLAEASPRITLTEYARTYENRPLVYLTITSEKNHARLDEIKAQHHQLSEPERAGEINISDAPLVIYQGFSIHGNEPSGANAAPLVAYYLAAGQTEELTQLLDHTVILLDPSFNPDGMTRFSSWVNMHKNKHLTADPEDREYDEAWPRGRTNHYWFDLNRDWLPVQHPESQGRIRVFHQWKPNVLTDHHEMGTNSTFFFMPGEPTRTNPITPPKNQELTGKIGEFHARALDRIGSLYYSGEGYDDFYYGKGSTYPDANGSVGILFEQASSRGHVQETDNGLLRFSFTIRNQVTTALSTQAAAREMREELLSYQRDFYQDARKEATADSRRAFVFGEPADKSRTEALVDILLQHQIEVYPLKKTVTADGHTFEAGATYVVPLQQTQYKLIRGIFETQTTFEDSLFYDISSWTLPLAFNLPSAALVAKAFSKDLLGARITGAAPYTSTMSVRKSNYAYLIEWDDYYAPQAVYHVLAQGLRAKVSPEKFTIGDRTYDRGTVIVPIQNQDADSEAIFRIVQEASTAAGIPVYGVNTGNASVGSDLGSRKLASLQEPKILLLVGDGVSSYDAGEVWHLFDQRYAMPITKAEADRLGRLDLSRYTAVVMVDGSYGSLSAAAVDNLKNWVKNGGTLVAMRRAAEWAGNKGLIDLKIKKEKEKKQDADQKEVEKTVERLPYQDLDRNEGGGVVGGAIFAVEADLTHPLFYGFKRSKIPVFRRGTLFFQPAENPYATPAVYTSDPLLSGYINGKNLETLRNSAAVVVGSLGRGKVIALADNPNFRAFWYGTNKLFANAVFFGSVISDQAAEPAPTGKEKP